MNEELEAPEDNKKGWGKTVKVSLGVLGGLSLLMGYISAAGMQESEREAQARNTIDDFFAQFNARDIEGTRRTLHYPHIRIAESEVRIWNEPADFNVDFETLSAEGWTHSTLDACIMKQNSDEKAHFEIQFSMHKGSKGRYATYISLWVLTRKDDHWGIQIRSSFAPRPA
jgi:hypothetical protein